jgi:hypothetical protein
LHHFNQFYYNCRQIGCHHCFNYYNSNLSHCAFCCTEYTRPFNFAALHIV